MSVSLAITLSHFCYAYRIGVFNCTEGVNNTDKVLYLKMTMKEKKSKAYMLPLINDRMIKTASGPQKDVKPLHTGKLSTPNEAFLHPVLFYPVLNQVFQGQLKIHVSTPPFKRNAHLAYFLIKSTNLHNTQAGISQL